MVFVVLINLNNGHTMGGIPEQKHQCQNAEFNDQVHNPFGKEEGMHYDLLGGAIISLCFYFPMGISP